MLKKVCKLLAFLLLVTFDLFCVQHNKALLTHLKRFVLDICWCWFHSSSFNLWAMWTHSTHSNEIWFSTCCSKNWRSLHALYLLYIIIHWNGMVCMQTLLDTLTINLLHLYMEYFLSFQFLLFIQLCFGSVDIHQHIILQDFTIQYLTLIMIRIEHKHKVLSQMDLVLMELILEVLIMLSIGELCAIWWRLYCEKPNLPIT